MVVAGAILVAVLVPQPAPDNSSPTSFATGRSGTYALYHLVISLGGRAVRVSGGRFAAGISGSGSLVEADPTTPFSPAQATEVADFVRRGGTLLLAGGSHSEDAPLLRELGLSAAGSVPSGTYSARLPVRGLTGLRVRTRGVSSSYLPIAHVAATPLLGTTRRPWGAVVNLGRGEAIVIGTEYPLSNVGLSQANDATFAVLALGVRRGATVLFDEVHHGYTLGDGVGALLWGTPLGAAAIVVAVILLLYLATSGRRLGRAREPRSLGAHRSTTDHLQAMAELYARTSDRRGVAQRYADELRRETIRATTLGVPAAEVAGLARLLAELDRAARDGAPPAKLRDLAHRARQAELRLSGASAPGTTLEVGTR